MRRAYFDHAATSPPGDAVRSILAGAHPFGNPSGVHAESRAARAVLDDARSRVAAALGVDDDEVIFAGSGTEACNMAVRGRAWAAGGRAHHVVSAVEHEAVHRTARWLGDRGADVAFVPPGPDGSVDAGRMAAAIRDDTALVALMAVNNEVGSLQPVAEVGAACAARGVPFFVDAVQATGRVPLDVAGWNAALAAVSPHKVGGPKGTGVLVARRGLKLQPALTGGEQESGLRPGTENVVLALAGAAAVAEAVRTLPERSARLGELTRRLESGLAAIGVPVHGGARAPGFVNAAFAGCDAATLVPALDLAGFAVSSGSACSSGSVRPSRVLEAMGLDEATCRASVRFSLAPSNTEDEIDALLRALPDVVARARGVLRVRPSPG
jgi:cysteine desulfurase